MTLQFKPIFRTTQNFNRADNLSFDAIISYKINDKWSAGFLERYWIMFDRTDRNFFFFDLKYSEPIPGLSLKSYSRWRLHWAQDLQDVVDGDFFRWEIGLSPKWDKKYEPYFAADAFYRLDNDPGLQRIRWQVGCKWKFAPDWLLQVAYWREDLTNVDGDGDLHIPTINLVRTL